MFPSLDLDEIILSGFAKETFVKECEMIFSSLVLLILSQWGLGVIGVDIFEKNDPCS